MGCCAGRWSAAAPPTDRPRVWPSWIRPEGRTGAPVQIAVRSSDRTRAGEARCPLRARRIALPALRSRPASRRTAGHPRSRRGSTRRSRRGAAPWRRQLLSSHVREPAVAALGARELVDQVLEALLGLAQTPLLEALETFFERDLIVEVLRGHGSSLRSERAFGLALRELRRLSGALEAGLLPLLGARVAREKTGLAERRKVFPVHLKERARDAVRDRADLAADATAFDLHHRVEATRRAGDRERQEGLIGRTVASEVVIQRLSVHDDRTLAGYEADASDGRLSTPRALEVRQGLHDSVSLRIGSGFCAACGCSAPAYT